MKWAVMSDAHANPKALREAIADARGLECGRFILLGDVTGYGYDVRETLRLARESFDIVLMGNHDSMCLGLEPAFDRLMNKNYRLDIAHHDELSGDELKWLGDRPYKHEEGDAAFVHGDYTAPRAWNYILSASAVLGNFFMCPRQVLFCGHTHHAEVWELGKTGAVCARLVDEMDDPAKAPESLDLPLQDGCRYIVNVGSVGYPRNDFCSTYAIYDDEARRVTMRRLPVDIRAYADELSRRGIDRPAWLVRWFAENGAD